MVEWVRFRLNKFFWNLKQRNRNIGLPVFRQLIIAWTWLFFIMTICLEQNAARFESTHSFYRVFKNREKYSQHYTFDLSRWNVCGACWSVSFVINGSYYRIVDAFLLFCLNGKLIEKKLRGKNVNKKEKKKLLTFSLNPYWQLSFKHLILHWKFFVCIFSIECLLCWHNTFTFHCVFTLNNHFLVWLN